MTTAIRTAEPTGEEKKMTTAIHVADVDRAFGRTHALSGLGFDVEENSITGLLGRNGVGKTTIMSIIAGQDRPTRGEIRVHGRAPFENAEALRTISYVRDNQRYPDDYRLRHVLRIAPEFAPNWSAELADEIVERFRIPAKTAIKKFSRGQLSSVAILLSLASRAPITLLDEPYLGLDVSARGIFHDILLRDYGEHPRTIVLSTHLIEESQRLFDRVVIMEAGRAAVDAEADSLGEYAFTVSGPADAVGDLIGRRTVLSRRAVGPLTSATVKGTPDADLERAARERGLYLNPVTLNDLVLAVGEGSAESAAQGGL